jgi:hypothetical protein
MPVIDHYTPSHGLFLFSADLSGKQEKAIFFSAPLCLEARFAPGVRFFGFNKRA